MTDEEHHARAMLLGGDPYYVAGRYCARIFKRVGNVTGTAFYDYVDTVTLEVIHKNRGEIEHSRKRFSSDEYTFSPEFPTRIG